MAVFTPVSAGELSSFLKAYDVGELQSYEGIAEGVENSNFRVTTGQGRFILTLFEKRVAESDLPFFLSLMTYLAESGVPTARAIAQRDGTMLGQLCGRPAALIEHLNGVATLAPSPDHCHMAGTALAQMHLASAAFEGTRANSLGLVGWADLLTKTAPRADEVQSGFGALLQAEWDALQAIWPTGLPQGVIHADLFPDNVLFDGSEIGGLIDFYFACTDAYAYDLAITLNAWCFDESGSFLAEHAAAMTKGYQSLRPLSAEERSALPALARGAALRFALTRLNDWLTHDPDALVTPKDPLALLPNLRFHAGASPSVYGV